jgi:hypothetical protein
MYNKTQPQTPSPHERWKNGERRKEGNKERVRERERARKTVTGGIFLQ